MTTLLTLCLSLLTIAANHAAEPASAHDVLAAVNGVEITTQDLDAYFAIRGLRSEASASVREAATQKLIDRELMRQFLERRKTVADVESLAAAMRAAKKRLAPEAEDVAAALAELGLDEARVQAEISLTLAWNLHATRTIADSQIREYWKEHQRRLDGSRLRVSQIFRKYEPGESADAAPMTTAALQQLRKRIAAGSLSFADAAKTESQAPTAANGGDVGWISPRGDLPASVSKAAYRLEVDGISEVLLSPFGAHLVTVTEVKPGDLSLEDARPVISSELSQQLWDDTVANERKTAKIDESRG